MCIYACAYMGGHLCVCVGMGVYACELSLQMNVYT